MSLNRLILKPGKDRALIHRHPWLFSGAVAEHPRVEEGAIIEVVNSEGLFRAYGFYGGSSQISARLFEFEAGHDVYSENYWHQKIDKAFRLRKELIDANSTNCYRLLHSEGDFFPGIIVDVYDKTASVQLLIKGTEKLKDTLAEALRKIGIQHLYLKTKTSSQNIEKVSAASQWLGNEGAERVTVIENNLKFMVDVVRGQKTGFFIDQRENRKLIHTLSAGKKVLNAFSYTGGFSVYALAGGATEVISVDISKDACEMAEKNIGINGFSHRHTAIAGDCFDYLKNMPDDFDLIILDPPAFAKNARSVPNATRGYKEINMAAFRKIKPGGLLATFSCSQNIDKMLFQKIIFGAAADARRNVRIIQQLGQGPDHPINIFHPEGDYLKGLLLWVE